MINFNYIPNSFQGFWYLKNGTSIELPSEMEHIQYLLENPEEFGIPPQELESICAKYGITVKEEMRRFLEMSDREMDIMICALSKGAVRVRIYDTFDDKYISLEYFGNRNKKYVVNCLIDMEAEVFSKIHLPFYIYNYDDESAIDTKSIDQAIVDLLD